QCRLPAARAAGGGDRPGPLRSGPRAAAALGDRRLMTPLRIAHVGPVATSIPPQKSGSVQLMTSLLNEGLVARGHQVTLFATGDSRTKAHLHALFPHGYWHDHDMWPWEMYEMMNLAAAVEHSRQFDIIHFQA